MEGSNFLLDLLIVVVLWMMSRENPDLDLRIQQSASAIASSAAILEICAYSFVNPMNLKLASPSVMWPSKFLRFDCCDIGEQVTVPSRVAL